MADEVEFVEITIEKAPRCHWHSNCTTPRAGSGVMKIVREDAEAQRTVFECLGCGKWGYVPYGHSFGVPFRSPPLPPEAVACAPEP